MIDIKYKMVNNINFAYQIIGNGKIDIVVEMGLGSSIGEWIQVAEKLSHKHTVLLYERAGIDLSGKSEKMRTPESIANELYNLVKTLKHEEKIILLAHSQGGLYAQQFARNYPSMVKGLVLLDPLSADDNRFKEELSDQEYKKSGVNKSSNFKIAILLIKLHLNVVIKSLMKSAPPFYYYKSFTKEETDNILNAWIKATHFKTMMEEYQLAHKKCNVLELSNPGTFPDIPIALIVHDSEIAIKENMEFGRNTREFAERVEEIWQELMRKYLIYSKESKLVIANKSSHYIHLTDRELIDDCLEWIERR